jgi:hypothetical protein
VPAYRVTFEDNGRIGRTRGNGDLVITARDANDVADQVYRHVKNKLASRWFEVTVDLEAQRGSIECGRFGRFTVVPLTEGEN